VLATVGGRLHLLSPCRARSSRGAPSLAMEAARAELAERSWRWPARSSPSGHGGGPRGARQRSWLGQSSSADHGGESCRARRPTMERVKNSPSISPLRACVAPNSSASLSSLGFLHDGLASAALPSRACSRESSMT
jgi:hypothetical protein